MITLKEYKTEDWPQITDAVEPFMFIEPFENFNQIVQRGVSVTAFEDDKVMACGGIALMNTNSGITWLKISKECLNKSYRWARTIKETFALMLDSFEHIEVTTYILDEFCKGEGVAKLIGMKKVDETEEHNGNIYNKYMVVT